MSEIVSRREGMLLVGERILRPLRKRFWGGEGGEKEEGTGDSPPVAKGGLLTNPAINLSTQNPAKLSTSAVGI